MSSGLGCLRLAIDKRGICLIKSRLGSCRLALSGIKLGLGCLDVDDLKLGFGSVIGGLGGSSSGLSLLVLALGGVHVHIGCGESVLGGILPVYSCEVSFPCSSKVLLRLGKLALELLELRLLRLRAARIVGGIDVVVEELLELGDSEISLRVIIAVIEDGYLGIGILAATGRDADGSRRGIDNVEIVPALVVDAVVVLIDVIGLISIFAEFVAILLYILVENLLFLSIEAGIGPAEGILGLAAGICAASASKVFAVVEVAVRVSPDVR